MLETAAVIVIAALALGMMISWLRDHLADTNPFRKSTHQQALKHFEGPKKEPLNGRGGATDTAAHGATRQKSQSPKAKEPGGPAVQGLPAEPVTDNDKAQFVREVVAMLTLSHRQRMNGVETPLVLLNRQYRSDGTEIRN